MHGLYNHQGLNSLFQLHQTKDKVLFYFMYIFYSPVGYELNEAIPPNYKAGTTRGEVRSLLRAVSN